MLTLRVLVQVPVMLLVYPVAIESPSFQQLLGPQPANRQTATTRGKRETEMPRYLPVQALFVCVCVETKGLSHRT